MQASQHALGDPKGQTQHTTHSSEVHQRGGEEPNLSPEASQTPTLPAEFQDRNVAMSDLRTG